MVDSERPIAARFIGVSKEYNSGNVRSCVLEDVSFEIRQGDFASIMGPSGCGKTTLLNILGGLDKPDSGEVYIADKKVSELEDKELTRLRREEIGFVFQFFNLMPTMTVYENIDLPLLLNGDLKKGSENAVKLLDYVGLSHRRGSFPAELSGGEMQRVAIARSLVHKPDLILADEPTGNLDSKSGQEVIQTLEALNETGITLIIITHDPAIGDRANRRIHMLDGAIERDA